MSPTPRRFGLAILLVLLLAAGHLLLSPVPHVAAADYRSYADAGMAKLQTCFNIYY